MSDFFEDADCPLFFNATPEQIIAQLAKIPPDFKLYRPGEASPEEIEANLAKLRTVPADPHP